MKENGERNDDFQRTGAAMVAPFFAGVSEVAGPRDGDFWAASGTFNPRASEAEFAIGQRAAVCVVAISAGDHGGFQRGLVFDDVTVIAGENDGAPGFGGELEEFA